MIRPGVEKKHSVELVHPTTGEVILFIPCDDRVEYVDLAFKLRAALQATCDMTRDVLDGSIMPVLRRLESVREGEGFDDRGPWWVTQRDIDGFAAGDAALAAGIRKFLEGKRLKIHP